MTTATRIWDALCEMRANSDVIVKDEFVRRVTEILAAEEAEVEIKPTAAVSPINGDFVKAYLANAEKFSLECIVSNSPWVIVK